MGDAQHWTYSKQQYCQCWSPQFWSHDPQKPAARMITTPCHGRCLQEVAFGWPTTNPSHYQSQLSRIANDCAWLRCNGIRSSLHQYWYFPRISFDTSLQRKGWTTQYVLRRISVAIQHTRHTSWYISKIACVLDDLWSAPALISWPSVAHYQDRANALTHSIKLHKHWNSTSAVRKYYQNTALKCVEYITQKHHP